LIMTNQGLEHLRKNVVTGWSGVDRNFPPESVGVGEISGVSAPFPANGRGHIGTDRSSKREHVVGILLRCAVVRESTRCGATRWGSADFSGKTFDTPE